MVIEILHSNIMQQLMISVIISSRNRSILLEGCVSSIQKTLSVYPIHQIILVDNCTDPEESKKYKEIAKIHNITYCREAQPGLSKARNAGIKNATGEIIVFADDDFIVKPEWIKNMVIHYSDPVVACCTGRMVSNKHDGVSQLYERSASFDRGPSGYRVTAADMNILNLLKSVTEAGKKRLGMKTPAPYSVGYGFCSFRKNVFELTGLFDEKLGRGTPAVGSEDVDMFYRILKAGFAIDYEPEAVILHEHRSTFEAILNDAYSAGISVRAFTRKYMAKDMYIFLIFIGNIFLLFFSLVRASLVRDYALEKMVRYELRGFFKGTRKV
jgi:glycosyltransferase involved in cell wall biosynthesis